MTISATESIGVSFWATEFLGGIGLYGLDGLFLLTDFTDYLFGASDFTDYLFWASVFTDFLFWHRTLRTFYLSSLNRIFRTFDFRRKATGRRASSGMGTLARQ